ncbi:hypothetical protein K7711_21490 [Nocardia sp. CA2R105]|uniref:glycosyltransferase family protein n=1 Tax=Nocardia coffeae TaxID=2873381 RepID=UPI001CA5F8AA|nr:hypothetical protein [Nocardia coffeae]MBY8859062.1 hypothetical protein [Nocardia coffeae]
MPDLLDNADKTRFAVTIAPPETYVWREAFREVAETVNIALQRLGHSSVLTDAVDLPGRRHILFGSNTLSWWGIEIPDDTILYNLEAVTPESDWHSEELLELFRRYHVWDYNRHNVAALRAAGVPRVQYVPIGGVPELDRIRPAVTQDIDVLFVGTYSAKRAAPIEQLQQAGYNAQLREGVWGAQRDDLYARAKIVLNLHGPTIFEVVRVSYLLANGIFVISEKCHYADEEEEFADGVVFVEYDRIAETCIRYLSDHRARAARITAGREIMRKRSARRYIGAALAEPAFTG